MTRYYFYSADLYYYDPAGGAAPARIGDYQGVYENDDDSTTPSQAFTNLMEELKKAIPAELGANDNMWHARQRVHDLLRATTTRAPTGRETNRSR